MVRKQAAGPAPLAFSYIRFSSPTQADGDSVRRQEDLRGRWLEKVGAVLDTTLTLKDQGVSAFTGKHRENPDRHALATFLELVRRGRIPRGSYLVVESLDRLSREHIRPALTLLLNLIDAGIRVVQLLPVEAVYDENVEPMALMMAIMELSRGNSESKMKSERVGAAWLKKKQAAAAGTEPLTKRTVAWLRVEGDRFVVDEEKASAVRRVYDLAAAGYGIGLITKRLNVERVPPIARADYWARSYVAKLLANRSVLGEYQPFTGRNGKRRTEGAPVPGHFPAIITEAQWHAAHAGMAARKMKGGQLGRQRINLFATLLRDARDGKSPIHIMDKGRGRAALMVPYHAVQGVKGTRMVSFPAEVFEEAVLSMLREINPAEVLPEGNGAAERVVVLTGKVLELEGRIEKVKAQLLDGGEVASLADVLRTLEGRLSHARNDLDEAQRAAASPLSAAWGECRSLADTLAAAPDPEEARLRLRSAIRRIVKEGWCLFVARASWRLAAVQLWFTGGKRRDYLILSKPATGGSVGVRPAKWWARSLAEIGAADSLDLRKRGDARKLEKALEEVVVSERAL
jgi:DNA invertase Pin-like site-specific DNA recombinase